MNTSAIGGLSYFSPPIAGTQKAERPAEDFQTILQQTLNEEQGKANRERHADQPSFIIAHEMASTSPYETSVPEGQQSQSININGIRVLTSGHSLDNREGISLLRTAYGTESNHGFSRLVSFAQANDPNFDEHNESAVTIEGDPMMTVVESKAYGPLPAGASSTYMDIDVFRPAGQWAEDPMSRSTTARANDSFYRRRTEELMRVVGVERQLKAQYGNDIKLIYSHLDEDYIMLTPDDARYNEMNSAESSVQTIIDEVHRGYINEDAVSDILSEYGYTV